MTLFSHTSHTYTHTHAHTHTHTQNSVRHSLSLGRFFRKVERTGTKRGFYWEVVPGKKAALDKELERFMREEGLVINGSTENEGGLIHNKIQVKQLFPASRLHDLHVSAFIQPQMKLLPSSLKQLQQLHQSHRPLKEHQGLL